MERVELPNSRWVRSPKKPEWSICLDMVDDFFGWLFCEVNGKWVSKYKMTVEDINYSLENIDRVEQFKPFVEEFKILLRDAEIKNVV